MDLESHAVANALVGNTVDAATLEFAHGGGEWEVLGPAIRIAVAGGSFAASIDNHPVPANTSALLREGQCLRVGGARDAVWGYLAVSGGLQVEIGVGQPVDLSPGRDRRPEGRTLAAGDVLPLRSVPIQGGDRTLTRAVADPHAPIRVVLGPQDDHFTRESIAVFLSSHFEVTWHADRMGYRLDGPALQHENGFNIVSDGILPGCIQVPGSGRPIVLLRDAQTTGGYPKLGTIISPDLGRFAQLRPLSKVRFKAISPDDAQILRREFISPCTRDTAPRPGRGVTEESA